MRKLSKDEARLLEVLIKKTSDTITCDLEEDLYVERMNDGRMGSLKLFLRNILLGNHVFGKQIAEYMFMDVDGIASLNIDNKGNLFGFDTWKTDFSPLIRIPEGIN